MSDFGNIFGNALRFSKFNLSDQWGKIKQNPERVFTGAMDPASTKVWNKAFDWTAPITGIHKHYDNSMVDQFGGPPPDTYQKAEAQGIPTAQAKTANAIARAVVAAYAGGAAYNAASGGGAVGSGGSFVPTEGSSFTIDPSGSYTTAYPSNAAGSDVYGGWSPTGSSASGSPSTLSPSSSNPAAYNDPYAAQDVMQQARDTSAASGTSGAWDNGASSNGTSLLSKNQLLSQALKGIGGGGQKQQQQPQLEIIKGQPAFMQQTQGTLPIQSEMPSTPNYYADEQLKLAQALRN